MACQPCEGLRLYIRFVAKIIHPTVVVECERCGHRSQPISEDNADAWLVGHEENWHVPEDRALRMEEAGHKITIIGEWMTQDDSSAHIACTCGFKSRSAKDCWMDDYANNHLIEAEAALGGPPETELPSNPARSRNSLLTTEQPKGTHEL